MDVSREPALGMSLIAYERVVGKQARGGGVRVAGIVGQDEMPGQPDVSITAEGSPAYVVLAYAGKQ